MMRNHHSDRAESRSHEFNPSTEGPRRHGHGHDHGHGHGHGHDHGHGHGHGPNHGPGQRHGLDRRDGEGRRPEGRRREQFGAGSSDPFIATTRQVVDAARAVRQGSNEAQIAAAQEVLSQARRSLYLILAEEPEAAELADAPVQEPAEPTVA